MPFPLAHPAAVLPLRRFCPRYLDWPALIIGSLSPDVGYIFGNLNAAYNPTNIAAYAHQPLAGAFGFCLPVGLMLVLVFYLIRLPIARRLPAPHRRVFLPLCRRPVGPLFLIVVSLMLGAWLHQLLDVFVNPESWLGRYSPVPTLGPPGLLLDAALYTGCTFFGVAWLTLVYLRWWELAAGAAIPRRRRWGCALLLAGAVLVIALGCRGTHPWIKLAPVGVVSTVIVLGFLLAIGWLHRPSEKQN